MKPLLFEYDRKLISILTPSEQIIIVMYYGLGDRHFTLAEIAKKFDISPQTVSKYRDKALQKLEKHKG
ncbi:MAG: sigma factor-like helix-turn-helix DNA-binding protein [Patescibacteria group bacterium]